MKNHIVICFVLIFFCVLSNAQNTGNKEINLSYGDGIHNHFRGGLPKAIASNFPQATQIDLKTKSWGNFGLGYRHQITAAIKLGLEIYYQ